MAECTHCGAELSAGASFCEECGKPVGKSSGWDDAGPVDLMTPMSASDTPDPDSDQFLPSLEPGSKFGSRYTIEQVLGQGGMGTVYKAMDSVSERAIALKLVRKENLGGEAAVRRLIDEGVLARDIRHPNVVSVYDVGLEEGQPFVAMEFLDGVSLRVWRGRKMQQDERVSMRVAARIVCEILDGLKAAHDAGVIHRDLKPENIILLGEPDEKRAPLKILDFGIARAVSADSSTASTTRRGLGTQYYMAPEQRNNPDAANAAADLYSISVILYEMLVGVTPSGPWQPPSGGRSDVPQEVDRLILKGMSADRTMRPQSAQQYREELVAAVNRVPVPPPPPPPGPPVDPGGKGGHTRGGMSGGSIALIASACVGVLFMLMLLPLLFPPSGDGTDGPNGPDDPDLPYCDEIVADGNTMCIGYDDNGNEVFLVPQKEVPYVPPEPPPVDPTPTWNEYLSGRWEDGLGGTYNISVQPSGSFTGNGRLRDGQGVGIRGTIGGGAMQYYISQNGLDVAEGQARQTDACHFAFQTYSYGVPVASGLFHANHKEGQPCP
ncbi:MAG: protein kinase [Hyphomonas sp.]|nr:protein kinase [Hyphomonas sp.]